MSGSEAAGFPENETRVIVQVDKTVITITGLKVKGLNTRQLEDILRQKLKTLIRVIGVLGDSIEMDAYGLDEDAVRRNEAGLIEAIALADGISVSDVTRMAKVERIRQVHFDDIPPYRESQCLAERWMETGRQETGERSGSGGANSAMASAKCDQEKAR